MRRLAKVAGICGLGLLWTSCERGGVSRDEVTPTQSTANTSGAGGATPSVSSAAPGAVPTGVATAMPSASAGATATATAGSSAPNMGAGCKSAVLCDDFEQATVGQAPAAPWEVDTNSGSVKVSSDAAKSGSKSVHFVGDVASYARAYMTLKAGKVFPAVAQEMFGRLWIMPKKLPTDVHWTIVQAEGPSADSSYRAYYRYGGQTGDGELLANYETDGKATDCWQHSKSKLPATWSCVEWRYAVATNEMQMWLDGKELTDMHVVGKGEGCVNHDLSDKWLAPKAFDTLQIGWEHYFKDDVGPFDVFIDDVGVGTQRIGCSN